jgi:hypothetical protein
MTIGKCKEYNTRETYQQKVRSVMARKSSMLKRLPCARNYKRTKELNFSRPVTNERGITALKNAKELERIGGLLTENEG